MHDSLPVHHLKAKIIFHDCYLLSVVDIYSKSADNPEKQTPFKSKNYNLCAKEYQLSCTLIFFNTQEHKHETCRSCILIPECKRRGNFSAVLITLSHLRRDLLARLVFPQLESPVSLRSPSTFF